MKILSIGNSFSQDAQRYLKEIADKYDILLKSVNLYIGGCSLQTHCDSIANNSKTYQLEVNGKSLEQFVSIEEMLLSDDWDVVTLQQASNFSADITTYTPYIEKLYAYVKDVAPKAKIYIHQTWAYETGSDKLKSQEKYSSSEEMYKDVCDTYLKAFKLIKADGIIPCGSAMYYAKNMGVERVHRDGFHAKLGVGRYILALTWLKTLLNVDITNDSFNDFDEPVLENERKIAINAVLKAVEEFKSFNQ